MTNSPFLTTLPATPTRSNSRIRAVLIAVVLLFFSLGTVIALVLVNRSQDLRQQAAVEGPTDDKKCDPNAWTNFGSCRNDWPNQVGQCKKRRVNNCGRIEYADCSGEELKACGAQPAPSGAVQTTRCYDKNQGCAEVVLPTTECSGGTKFISKDNCLAALGSTGGPQPPPSATPARCAGGYTQIPNTTAAKNSFAGNCQPHQRLDLQPLSVTTHTCASCVSKPMVNCYDNTKGCAPTTLYYAPPQTANCPALGAQYFAARSTCEANLAANQKTQCWYFDTSKKICIATTITGSCDKPTGAVPADQLFTSAGQCTVAHPAPSSSPISNLALNQTCASDAQCQSGYCKLFRCTAIPGGGATLKVCSQAGCYGSEPILCVNDGQRWIADASKSCQATTCQNPAGCKLYVKIVYQ